MWPHFTEETQLEDIWLIYFKKETQMIIQKDPELIKPATVDDFYNGRDIFKPLQQQYADIWNYYDSLSKKERLGFQEIKNDKNLNYIRHFLGEYVLSGGIGTNNSHYYHFGTIGKLYFDKFFKKIRMKTRNPASSGGHTGVIHKNTYFVSLIDEELYSKLFHTKLFFGDFGDSKILYPHSGFPIYPSPNDKSLLYLSRNLINRINLWYRDENNKKLF